MDALSFHPNLLKDLRPKQYQTLYRPGPEPNQLPILDPTRRKTSKSKVLINRMVQLLLGLPCLGRLLLVLTYRSGRQSCTIGFQYRYLLSFWFSYCPFTLDSIVFWLDPRVYTNKSSTWRVGIYYDKCIYHTGLFIWFVSDPYVLTIYLSTGLSFMYVNLVSFGWLSVSKSPSWGLILLPGFSFIKTEIVFCLRVSKTVEPHSSSSLSHPQWNLKWRRPKNDNGTRDTESPRDETVISRVCSPVLWKKIKNYLVFIWL